MKVVSGIVQCLQSAGISFLSAYPTTPLIDAAAREGLRPVVCRQERVGVGIADGFARVTAGDPPAAFAMQWGPGAENAFPGVATAYSDGTPLLLLPLGHPEDRASARGFFDSTVVFRPVTKHVERLTNPQHLADVMRRVLSLLRTGPPGPVMLEVPADIALADLPSDFETPAPPRPAVAAGRESDVQDALRLLREARSPLILAGQGVLYAGGSEALQDLAEHLALPVATTLAGKSAFPERHPLSLGTGGFSMPGPVHRFYHDADVVLAVGTSLTRHFLTAALPPGKRIIHVTMSPEDLNKDYAVEVPVLGDAKLVLEQMLTAAVEEGLGPRERGEVELVIAQSREEWLKEWAALLDSSETPINPYRVVKELAAALEPISSIVTHDSGSPRDQLVPFFRADQPRSYLGWGKSHGLGTGLGLTIGAKLARPDATAVHVMGDAAFGMVGLDFETAVREEIPILAVVLNNSIMAIEQRSMRVSHERFGARAIGGRYADLALAMGGAGLRVDNPEKLGATLQEAIALTREGTSVLLEVITSPEETPFSLRNATLRSSDASPH